MSKKEKLVSVISHGERLQAVHGNSGNLVILGHSFGRQQYILGNSFVY